MGTACDDEAIALIQSLQAGGQESFRELMEILKPTVEYAVWQFTHGSARYVDDLLQEAWIGVYKAAQRYDTITYPHLLKTYFRTAVINQLVLADSQTADSLAPPRAIARFQHDAVRGHVDWSQSNEEVHRSYPQVNLAEIERVRTFGGCTVTCMSNFPEVYDSATGAYSDASGFDEWATTRVDIEQILTEVRAQVSPMHYRIFELRFLQDLSRPSVAKMLGVSVVRVYTLERQLLATQFLVRYPESSAPTPETLRSLLAHTLSATA